jgi:hypothetical protein
MNLDYIVFHLAGAKSELETTLREIEANPEYDYGEFRVAMEHVYHHINSAWNARDASPERAKACTQADFRAWRQFPRDIELTD